jgi:hypothetical protein
MKVQTNLKAGQYTAVAVGSAAVNYANISQSFTIGGSVSSSTLSNTVSLTQSASSTNSGAVTATA